MNKSLDYYLKEFKENTDITSDVGFTKDLMLIVKILAEKGYTGENYMEMKKSIANLGDSSL